MCFEASDLGLHCLLRPICPNTWGYYSNYKSDKGLYLLDLALTTTFSLLLICLLN